MLLLKFLKNKCPLDEILIVSDAPANKEGLTHFSLPLAVTLYTSQDCVDEGLVSVTEKPGWVVFRQMRNSPFAGNSITPDFGSIEAIEPVDLQE